MAAPMIMDMNENRYSFYVFTDAADTGRKGGLSVKKGSFNTTFQQFFCNDAPKGRPLFQVMFEIIRICNKTIANVDRMGRRHAGAARRPARTGSFHTRIRLFHALLLFRRHALHDRDARGGRRVGPSAAFGL